MSFHSVHLHIAVHPGFPFDSYQISRTHRQQLGKESRKRFFYVLCKNSIFFCLRFMFRS